MSVYAWETAREWGYIYLSLFTMNMYISFYSEYYSHLLDCFDDIML